MKWLTHNQHFQVGDAELCDILEDKKDWAAYCKEMSRDAEWGDHVTLVALSEILQRPIIVYSSIREEPTTIQPHHVGEPIILFHISEVHYVSVRRR